MKASRVLIFIVSLTMVFLETAASYGEERRGSPEKGKILYNKLRCYYCHRINGIGGTIGPDLTKEGTKNRGVE